MPTQILSHAWNKEHAAWTPFRMGLLAFSGLALLTITQVAFTESKNYQQAKDARVAAAKEKPTVQKLIDSTGSFGRVVVTEDGTIVSWNHGMTKLTGWTSKEMVGGNAARIDPHDEADPLLFSRVFSRRPPRWTGGRTDDFTLKTKDGRTIRVGVAPNDLDGEPLYRELTFHKVN